MALLLAAGGWQLAAAQQRSLSLDDYYRLEAVSNPAISPDGRWVAYLRGFTVEAENRRRTELWVVPFDGSASPRRISDSTGNASDPRWSPDSRLLSWSAGGTNFVRVDRPAEPSFRIPGLNETPVWSPDGQWIAFTRATRPDQPPAGAISAEEKKLQDRFTGRAAEWMDYRFDGRGYLADPRDPRATPPREIYVLPAAGGTARKLTSLGVDATDLAWKPDGSSIAFVADYSQRDERLYERGDLFTVAFDGTLKRLTDDGFNHNAPAWLPDGSLVFLRQEGLSLVIASRRDRGAPVDLYRMPSTGGTMRNLTGDWDLLPGEPEVSPDGRFIAFTAGVGGDAHRFRLPAAGGAVEQVTTGARRLGGFSVSGNGDRMAYTATDPTHPAELFVARGNGLDERRLTRLNDALLAELALRPAERIQFRSRDSTPVEGWIMTPRASAATRAPLLLAIHGGPHGAYGTDFSFQFQYWVSRGYAVLFTNPRGSTGYGEPFLWGTWGAWGDRDGEDVLAGVDYAIRNYPVDSAKVGVTGYSYGGFLTNWIITQTARFQAAVTGAGISNWISDYGTADIPRTKESEFFGTPWEQRGAETLWRQSPIRLASRVRTPTMFIHGEADLRVPIEQAEQMYTALQKNAVPSRFVRYPGMYHGGWSPWNTVHRYNEETKWWDRWLKAATP
jgi:dipeptidyl aminopeptidase/acylaminoacyl peptidase